MKPMWVEWFNAAWPILGSTLLLCLLVAVVKEVISLLEGE